MRSDSHKSQSSQRVLNHLNALNSDLTSHPQAPGPHERTHPDLVTYQELQGVLTPPHSTSARGNGNSYYHCPDLVAISMGTGGWVLKFNEIEVAQANMLEPKCMIVHMHYLHL